MAPAKKENVVIGPFTLKGGRLTFHTENAHLVEDARRAQETDTDFTVTLSPQRDMKTITGKVESIDLLPNVRPQQWGVIIRVERRQ